MTLPTIQTEIDRFIAQIPNINTITDARRLLAIAQGYVITAHKLYKATDITTINEANEDKGKSLEISRKAGELRLYAEARLGELIKAEQEAGRLAAQGDNKTFRGNNVVTSEIRTLNDYGLSKIESSRAQELAEHKDIIAKVVVDSLDIPTRHAVLKEIKSQEHENKKISNILPVTPEGIYDVIIIDPPWPYGGRYDSDSHRIESPYKEMEIKDIIKWGLDNIKASDNSILWLWTTNAFLPDAFIICQKWEFEYKTLLTWVKNKMGTGYWLRGQTEHCLMSIKGKPQLNLTNQTTILQADNTGHSEKPDEFYNMIKILCPGKIIDMFARKVREGIEYYGNQLQG